MSIPTIEALLVKAAQIMNFKFRGKRISGMAVVLPARELSFLEDEELQLSRGPLAEVEK